MSRPASEKSKSTSSTVPATGIMYGNRNTDFSSLCRSACFCMSRAMRYAKTMIRGRPTAKNLRELPKASMKLSFLKMRW